MFVLVKDVILCNGRLAWQSQQKIMLGAIVLGVPTQVCEYRVSSQNSQPFAVTGISSTYYGRIQNFRLHTLGVPVSNSDSQEALRNSLMLRSSKLELTFHHRDVCVWQLKRVHWEFQCNYTIFENILKIPLTLSSKRVQTTAPAGSQHRVGPVYV